MSQTSTNYTIVIRGKNGMSTEHVLPAGRSVFLGSSDDCGIQIKNNEVASLHCLLDVGEDGLAIQDWASSTGTIVNGKAIDGKVTLSSDDSIVVGSAVISVRSGTQAEPSHRPLPQEEVNADQSPPPKSEVENEPAPSVDEPTAASPLKSENDSVVDALARIQAMIGEFKDGSQPETPTDENNFVEPESLDEPEAEVQFLDENDTQDDAVHLESTETEFPACSDEETHEVDLGSVDLIVIEYSEPTETLAEDAPEEIDLDFDPEPIADDSFEVEPLQDSFDSCDNLQADAATELPVSDGEVELEADPVSDSTPSLDSWGDETQQYESTVHPISDTWADNDDTANAPSTMSGWADYEQDESLFGETTYDQETVDLLKAEIEDLRALLAERDAQIAHIDHAPAQVSPGSEASDEQTDGLVKRIDELIQEATEHEFRMSTVIDLLEASEFKNDTEVSERQALECWLSEVENRMSETREEWRAELEACRQRLTETIEQRDHAQHQLRQVAARYNEGDGNEESLKAQQEMLDDLQRRNADLEEQAEENRKECAALRQQLEKATEVEPEDVQEQRALIAKERADVSRMRFELSQKLSEFENANSSLNEFTTPVDREVALRLQTLRSHLREIHEQERQEREERGESLISRISNLWKRADEY